MIVLLMGVSGAGKTTLGRLLAASWGCSFYDADDFHPPANIAKMRHGLPLNDADRQPWLETLRNLIQQLITQNKNAVLACSALKASYRAMLLCGPAVCLVYLKGNSELIASRLASRAGHYMPPTLLASQFAALEEPQDALIIEVDASPTELVARISEKLGARARN